MNKEGSIYYNLNGEFIHTKLFPVQAEQERPLYLLYGVSYKHENEIHLLEMCESDNSYKCLINIKVDMVITDCKTLNLKNKLFLIGVGMPSIQGPNEESCYFVSELNMKRIREGSFSPKINVKNRSGLIHAFDVIDEDVYMLSDYSIFKYNLNSMKFELFYDNYNKTGGQLFRCIKTDKKNRRLYVGQKNNILILDQSLQNNTTIRKAHDLPINNIDTNVNKNHQILTTANEQFLKFWDVRKVTEPNLIWTESKSLITNASFNSFYDQLVLYSLENGTIALNSANSISSSVVLKLNENEQIPENKNLKTMESALDDYVDSVTWNHQDAWIFGASSRNKAYFDIIGQNIRFDVMF